MSLLAAAAATAATLTELKHASPIKNTRTSLVCVVPYTTQITQAATVPRCL